MREWASSNGAVVRQRSGSQETAMARSRTLSKNAYYEELKPISNVNKEYIDEHESDSEILQYDSDEASVESEERGNEESLNLGRVFETSNENLFLNNTLIKVWQERKVEPTLSILILRIYILKIFSVKIALLQIITHQMITFK